MSKEIIERAGEVIRQNISGMGHCTLALIDADGYPTASTITASKADGINWLTFCTGLESNKAKRIEKCNRAGVCFNMGGDHNITLVGTIEIITDLAVREEMWYEGMGQHFSGPDDPGFCVLRFKTERYSLVVDWKEAEGTL